MFKTIFAFLVREELKDMLMQGTPISLLEYGKGKPGSTY